MVSINGFLTNSNNTNLYASSKKTLYTNKRSVSNPTKVSFGRQQAATKTIARYILASFSSFVLAMVGTIKNNPTPATKIVKDNTGKVIQKIRRGISIDYNYDLSGKLISKVYKNLKTGIILRNTSVIADGRKTLKKENFRSITGALKNSKFYDGKNYVLGSVEEYDFWYEGLRKSTWFHDDAKTPMNIKKYSLKYCDLISDKWFNQKGQPEKTIDKYNVF